MLNLLFFRAALLLVIEVLSNKQAFTREPVMNTAVMLLKSCLYDIICSSCCCVL